MFPGARARQFDIQKRNLAVAMPKEAANEERRQARRLRKMLDDLLRIVHKNKHKLIEDQTKGPERELAKPHAPGGLVSQCFCTRSLLSLVLRLCQP